MVQQIQSRLTDAEYTGHRTIRHADFMPGILVLTARKNKDSGWQEWIRP
jgi:hypothetical protein